MAVRPSALVRILVAVAVVAVTVALGVRPAAADVTTERLVGYLEMADGIRLRYTVVKPVGTQKLPTLFEYSGYDPGNNPDQTYVRQYVESGAGYNYIGVNIRGTGCSYGTFDFFQPQEALDAVEVIGWVRQQSWSDGILGMIGKSYPGITQLFVAEQNPEGLKAIAPGHFYADAYRDVARPGGIENYGFSSLWSFIGRPSYEFQSGTQEALEGDPDCINGPTGELRGLPTNPFVQLQQHPYDDDLVKERSPEKHLDRLRIPMLATLSWQDEQLASRGTDLLAQIDDLNRQRRSRGEAETPWFATLAGGDHGMARTATQNAELRRFYDHYLKGIDKGWDERPRVKVWWEPGRDGGARAPGWVTRLDHWSEAERSAAGVLTPLRLHLREGGMLTSEAPVPGEAPEQYAYTPGIGSQGIGNPAYGGVDGPPDVYFWDQAPPEGTALHWTTPPFEADTSLLGSASFDVWLKSSAPDTDLQVTLTEVRPDGQEVYVQKGWLKVSQRALDPGRSTELRPYQTHQEADVAFLDPLTPVLARVEIFPFGTLLRAGSRLRVWVEAPTVLPELWAFTPFPTPAVNTVLHDADHPSALVLPVVPTAPRPASADALPECGTVIRQPCRSDPAGADEPPPVVPEAPVAALLPVVAALLVVALCRFRRRRA